jgi:hypothetical protein
MKEAVEIAIRYDSNSGGPVVEHKIINWPRVAIP